MISPKESTQLGRIATRISIENRLNKWAANEKSLWGMVEQGSKRKRGQDLPLDPTRDHIVTHLLITQELCH